MTFPASLDSETTLLKEKSSGRVFKELKKNSSGTNDPDLAKAR
jgi:hypothetical protein